MKVKAILISVYFVHIGQARGVFQGEYLRTETRASSTCAPLPLRSGSLGVCSCKIWVSRIKLR